MEAASGGVVRDLYRGRSSIEEERPRRLAGADRLEDLRGGALNRIERLRKEIRVALVQLDVIRGRGRGIKTDPATDCKRDGFRLELAHCFCTGTSRPVMEELVGKLVYEHGKFRRRRLT